MFNLTPVHLHLLINHTPVMGSMAGVLLLLYGMIRKTAELERVALMTFVLTALLSFMSDQTGDGAAAIARKIPGVERQDIRAHSQSADTALLTAEITGAVALIGLILGFRRKDRADEAAPRLYVRWHLSPPRWAVVLSLLGGLATVYFMSVTAYTGGTIRHPEIESGYAVPDSGSHPAPTPR
jgi:hypothetical protein